MPRVLNVREAAAVLLALATASCAPETARTVTRPASDHSRIATTIRVQVKEGGALVVRDIPIEDYVTATVLSEVDPPDGDPAVIERMFEVQAIIARTYAVSNVGRHARDGFDLCSTTHCQLYEPVRLRTSRWASLAREGVQRTAGQILWFSDAPARAVFHADCGGHTSSAAAVWGGVPLPYLTAERDAEPAGTHVEWTFETRDSALRSALNADTRTAVGAKLDRIEVSGRDAGGRAEMITLRGTRTFVVRGETFRDAVTHALGVKSLRSTLFTIKRVGDRFVFSGKGFGHGVGLCQAGALARLQAGASPKDVLKHYFPGTALHR